MFVQNIWKCNDGSLLPLCILENIGIIGGDWLLPQMSSLQAPELDFICIQPLCFSYSPKNLSVP